MVRRGLAARPTPVTPTGQIQHAYPDTRARDGIDLGRVASQPSTAFDASARSLDVGAVPPRPRRAHRVGRRSGTAPERWRWRASQRQAPLPERHRRPSVPDTVSHTRKGSEMHDVRARFWGESLAAACTGVLLLVTLLSPDWIETVFGLDLCAGCAAYRSRVATRGGPG